MEIFNQSVSVVCKNAEVYAQMQSVGKNVPMSSPEKLESDFQHQYLSNLRTDLKML